jgi:hypothetical protein
VHRQGLKAELTGQGKPVELRLPGRDPATPLNSLLTEFAASHGDAGTGNTVRVDGWMGGLGGWCLVGGVGVGGA